MSTVFQSQTHVLSEQRVVFDKLAPQRYLPRTDLGQVVIYTCLRPRRERPGSQGEEEPPCLLIASGGQNWASHMATSHMKETNTTPTQGCAARGRSTGLGCSEGERRFCGRSLCPEGPRASCLPSGYQDTQTRRLFLKVR